MGINLPSIIIQIFSSKYRLHETMRIKVQQRFFIPINSGLWHKTYDDFLEKRFLLN